MNNTKKNKLLLYIGVPVIIMLIFLRFGLYFLRSDGFSGLSMLLPILLLGFLTIIITLTMVKGALLQEVEESLRGTAYATLAAYEQNSGIYLLSSNGDVWKGSYWKTA